MQSDQAFWELHDLIFKNQSSLHSGDIVEGIEKFGNSISVLDQRRFRACFDKQGSAKWVDSDIALAQRYKIEATPTVFVNNIRIDGVASSEQLRTLIHQLQKVESARVRHSKGIETGSKSN